MSKELKEALQLQRERDRFRKLDAARKKALTERGQNPFESEALRQIRRAAYQKKQAEEHKRICAEFDALPAQRRKIFTQYGWNPHQDKEKTIIYRAGSVSAISCHL